MPAPPVNGLLDHVRRTALRVGLPEKTDGQLLTDFITRQDEESFSLLFRRHAPMVFGVCQRVIGRRQDAEDAFQATFLVLSRKAASVRPRDALGNWLYGVAYRTARRARAIMARRCAREKQVTNMPQPKVEPVDEMHDLEPILDEELARLADKHRLPLVLCDLEGRPRRQVAKQLGIADGTLSTRLAAARKLLAARLSRRGVALSAAGLAAVLSAGAARAHVPSTLVSPTIEAATLLAAGKSAAAPGKEDYLRPAKESPLASEGAGREEPTLPRYVGAVPPPDASAWDWSKTWEARRPKK